MHNLTIIGTSHISPESIQEVKTFLLEKQPDIVCLELDKGRIHALNSHKKPGMSELKRIGVKGFLFLLFGAWAEKQLGKMVGTKPGDEMRVAVAIAKERNMKVAVIDRPIEITLKRLMKLTWKEKLRFVKELFTVRRKLPFDLKKVPATQVIETLLEEVKRKFPTAYRVLITERNEYMAARLKIILEKHPDEKIVAVVGAGHVKGIKKILSNI